MDISQLKKVRYDGKTITEVSFVTPAGDTLKMTPTKGLGPVPTFKEALQKLAPVGLKYSAFKLRAGSSIETRALTLHHLEESGFLVQISIVGTAKKVAGGQSVTSGKVNYDKLTPEEQSLVDQVIQYSASYLEPEKRVQLSLFDEQSTSDLLDGVEETEEMPA